MTSKTVYIDTSVAEADERAIFKYVDSDRSDGKTTAAIRLCYDAFAKTGKAGVICRRFAGEAGKLYAETLVSNLKKVRDVKGEIRINGSPKKDGVSIFVDGERLALLVPLSRAGAIKSTLDKSAFGDIYIDEYVPIDGRYLRDEPEKILELYNTVDRRTFSTQVWIFSNRPTASNPIFAYFSVRIPPPYGVSRWKNGRLLILRVKNRGNMEQMKKSPLGELVEGTPYEDYIAGGSTIQGPHDIPVRAKGASLRTNIVFALSGAFVSVYRATDGREITLVRIDQPRAGDAIYELSPTPAVGNKSIYIADSIVKWLRVRLRIGAVYAHDVATQEAAQQLVRWIAGR